MRETLSEKMLELLVEEADIQTIVNEATLMLSNPIVIIDTKFHIMYSSTNIEVNIDLWKETMAQEYVSDEIISEMEASEVISRLTDGREVVEHNIPEGHKALRLPMYYKNKYVGFIGIYDYVKPLAKEDGDSLKIVARAVMIGLEKRQRIRIQSDNSYEYLLEELVCCDNISRAELICQKNEQISFGKKMRIICLGKRGDEQMKKNMAAERIREMMDRYLYKHYSTIYGNHLVMLFALDSMSDELWKRTLTCIETYCQQYNLIAGCSFEFNFQKLIPNAYQQALYALQCEEHYGENYIGHFTDYMMDSIIDQCTKNYPEQFYTLPEIEKLIAYDKEFHTEYFYTLKVYLDNFCSLKETAKELDIHYNTMKYRISMIESIIENSLKSNNQLKTNLIFSIHFQKKQGCCQRKKKE